MKELHSESRYFDLSYLNEGRFVDYYHTLRCALSANPKSILEIGPGNGLVSYVLKKMGKDVTTLDICEDVDADLHASVTDMPFSDSQFETVICCEVLEHLPWEQSKLALVEIKRVARKSVVISLPHDLNCWFFTGNFPVFGDLWGSFTPPQGRKSYENHPEHFWQVGSREVSEKELCRTIEKIGFKIKQKYRPGANKCHIFFELGLIDE